MSGHGGTLSRKRRYGNKPVFYADVQNFPPGPTHLVASILRRCASIGRSRRLRKEQGGFAAAANLKVISHRGTSNSNVKSKLHPCSFDLAAAAQALFRLAARNASHFGVTSCHAIQRHIHTEDLFDRKMK
ncbi:MAG: hypothetical protein LBU06_05600 [Desulfovibrio sp.]|jgi:hypothetical protein|nr:hypothetical protein [Desulfovibrio sp.]